MLFTLNVVDSLLFEVREKLQEKLKRIFCHYTAKLELVNIGL